MADGKQSVAARIAASIAAANKAAVPSAAASAHAESASTPITSVQLDALARQSKGVFLVRNHVLQVVLKIIKHCRESLPNLVSGQLLGLDVEARLDVTNCFPMPSSSSGGDGGESSEEAYQRQMLDSLAFVNVESNAVGWYQSTYLGSYIGKGLLDSQFAYQTDVTKSVVIVYDPFRTAHGTLALRAFRLSSRVMDLIKESNFTSDALTKAGISRRNLFEEVPITIRNSALVNAFVDELEEQQATVNFDQLELTSDPFLEKNLEFMLECTDEFNNEQYAFYNYQRQVARQQQQLQMYITKRKYENAARAQRGEPPLPLDDGFISRMLPDQPSRLATLLVSRQIDAYCRQVNQFASQAFSKLFLTSSLQ